MDEQVQQIHSHIEQLAHLSKHMYTRALRVKQLVERPEIDIWTHSFRIHERAATWAKRHMVASKCSLWQIHETLLATSKMEGGIVLPEDAAAILDLGQGPHSIWRVLGRLDRFFVTTEPEGDMGL